MSEPSRPPAADVDAAIDASLGITAGQCEVILRKTKPQTSEQMVKALALAVPVDEMQRWAGLPEHPIAMRMRLRLGRRWEEARMVWWTARDDARAKRKIADIDLFAWKTLAETMASSRSVLAVPSATVIEAVYNKIEADKPKIDPKLIAKLNELGAGSNPLDDAIFVSEHFHDPDGIEKATTRGALMLLIQSRENPSYFWNSLWPKLAADQMKRIGTTSGKSISPRERASIDELREMLRAAVKASESVK